MSSLNAVENESTADGRTARRDRNREIVLDATIELFSEGNMSPGAIDVAERSGLSLRSVYRYFEDIDALTAAAVTRFQERFAGMYQLDALGEGPLDERISRLVDHRFNMYLIAGNVMKMGTALAAHDDFMRGRIANLRALFSQQVDEMFAPEFDSLSPEVRAETKLAVEATHSVGAFDYLLQLRAIDSAQAKAVIIRQIAALFAFVA